MEKYFFFMENQAPWEGFLGIFEAKGQSQVDFPRKSCFLCYILNGQQIILWNLYHC